MGELFFRLLLAHLLADFALQWDRIYRLKQQGHKGLAVHSLIVLGCSLALLWPRLTAATGGLVLAVAVIHHALDHLKGNWRAYPTGLAGFLMDQAAHGLVLAVAASAAVRAALWPSGGAGAGTPAWAILASGALAATLVLSFVTYYLDRSERGFPAPYRRAYAALALQLGAYAAAAVAVLGEQPLWWAASAGAAALQLAGARSGGPQGLAARWAGPLGASLLGAGAAWLVRLGL